MRSASEDEEDADPKKAVHKSGFRMEVRGDGLQLTTPAATPEELRCQEHYGKLVDAAFSKLGDSLSMEEYMAAVEQQIADTGAYSPEEGEEA